MSNVLPKPGGASRGFAPIQENPITTATLAVLLLFACRQVYLTARPFWHLDLPGYPSEKMVEAYVIALRPGCSCETTTEDWLTAGTTRSKNMALLGDGQSSPFLQLRSRFERKGVAFLHSNEKNLSRRLAPSGRTTLNVIRHGRIVQQVILQDNLRPEGVFR
ncbi:MAG: hypothetical protein SFU56_15460 [Capsulimonadales bacterium]|nr:hypothetical protein [Capsulimonadales bacterium]